MFEHCLGKSHALNAHLQRCKLNRFWETSKHPFTEMLDSTPNHSNKFICFCPKLIHLKPITKHLKNELFKLLIRQYEGPWGLNQYQTGCAYEEVLIELQAVRFKDSSSLSTWFWDWEKLKVHAYRRWKFQPNSNDTRNAAIVFDYWGWTYAKCWPCYHWSPKLWRFRQCFPSTRCLACHFLCCIGSF